MLRWREAISSYSGQDEKEGSCSGNVKIIHRLPTSHRQVWINQGDIILISLRDFQDDKADVIVKYTADEARNRTYYLFYYEIVPRLRRPVKAYGELPENAKINETDTFGEEDGDCIFDFGDEGEVDIDDI